MTLGHNQRSRNAFAFQQGVRSNSAAVMQSSKLASKLLFRFDDCSDLVDAVLDANGLVVRSGRDFGSIYHALGGEDTGVGECSALAMRALSASSRNRYS